MRSKILQSPLSALHAWAFVPVPLGTSRELVHCIEHRLFLDGHLMRLEDEVVRHNGMTHWSGILLEFTIPLDRLNDLKWAIENLFKKELPPLLTGERERFARELEEGGGNFLDSAIDLFREEIWKENALEHDGKDEEGIWSSLDFDTVRFFAVGDRATVSEDWNSETETEWEFPVMKKEIAPKEDDSFLPQSEGFEYVLLFASNVSTPMEYAFHSLFMQSLRLKTDKEYRDTGRTYDPISEDFHENGFVLSAIHLITNDSHKKLPALPKLPTESEFLKMRDSLAFQEAVFQDELRFEAFPVLGFGPNEYRQALETYPYANFAFDFEASKERLSIFWGEGR